MKRRWLKGDQSWQERKDQRKSDLEMAASAKALDVRPVFPIKQHVPVRRRAVAGGIRRMKPISRTTIATIFTEAIDNAVPRNSEVMIRWSGFGSIAAGNSSPSANPQAPSWPVNQDWFACRDRHCNWQR